MHIDIATVRSAQDAINGLTMRLQELAVDEARGRRVNLRLRRSLIQKRDEAHRQLKMALGKQKH